MDSPQDSVTVRAVDDNDQAWTYGPLARYSAEEMVRAMAIHRPELHDVQITIAVPSTT